MSKRYITSCRDGSITVAQIVGDDDGRKLAKMMFELSRDGDVTTRFDPSVHTLAVIAEGVPGHYPLAVLGECDELDLPPDRYFRDAWAYSGGKVQVDMHLARSIHMVHIREARDAVLSGLDVPWMKAVEAGDRVAIDAIVIEKQKLRDIPQNFDLSHRLTPGTLKLSWPDGLPRP